MQFEFATAGRIVFGPGKLKDIGALAGAFGRRALVVTGAHPERADGLRELLGQAGVRSKDLSIDHEPTTEDLRRGVRLAQGDPELTLTVPPVITASTGLDALTQLIEPFVSARASPITDALCREGLRRVARSLRRAHERGDDRGAREDMSLAALFSGLAMANAGLGSVHGFAGVIGGMVSGPHGAVCAALLPYAIRINVRALGDRAPRNVALDKYREVGQLLTGKQAAGADEAVSWVADVCAALRVPRLASYGLSPAQLPELLDKSAVASSMKANPIALTRVEMQEIVVAAM
ncbi:MAG: iron-containing alcohol dehydrogenase [Chloroflexi bacterium]|nr:iron-containing alcohol dehydrogenase [Chloroflexota bacterium]